MCHKNINIDTEGGRAMAARKVSVTARKVFIASQ